jgi:hypothetical protein
MNEIFWEVLNDTGKLIPLLLGIYFLVSFLEDRYGQKLGPFMARLGAWGPLAGALFGCIPQCGFSVIAAALYVKRMISKGTLLAVFISTSDEAVPVLFSMPDQGALTLKLILIKVGIAIVFGLVVDLAIKARTPGQGEAGRVKDIMPQMPDHHCGCCSHGLTPGLNKFKALVVHPLRHTVKIFAFLFLLSLIMNILLVNIGEQRLAVFLLQGSFLQPVLASFIGLIPNCFASVLLAELFSEGAISFGSLLGGLSAGCGLGLLLLIKDNRNIKDTAIIIFLLLAVSISVGITAQLY